MGKHLIALGCITMMAACGDDEKGPTFWDGRPVDGWYVVSVTPLENTCSDELGEPSPRVFMDFFLRYDGLYNIYHRSMAVPGIDSPEGVKWEGGNVSHSRSWKSGETDHALNITGTLTPDEVDLEWRFDGYPDCHITARIAGTPWPLRDPNSLEGFYGFTVTPRGLACGNDPRTDGPPRNVVSTISDVTEGGYYVGLFDSLFAIVDEPANDGTIDWVGQVMIPTGIFDLPLEATLRGTLRPDDVDLDLNFWEVGQNPETSDCTYENALDGAKRLPSVSEVDSDYRMRFWIHDGCTGDPDRVDRKLDSSSRLVTQPDGKLQILDPAGSTTVSNHAGTLSTTFGTFADDGFTAVLAGTIAPPHLTYTVDYDVYDETGAVACVFSVVADGQARFVFE